MSEEIVRVLTASTSAFVIVGAKFLKNIEVVLCSARDSFFSTTTSFAWSTLSLLVSLSLFSSVFSTLGDLDRSFSFGDLSGVFDLDLDLDLRRDVESPSSSELDDEELDDDELDEEPGGAEKISRFMDASQTNWVHRTPY